MSDYPTKPSLVLTKLLRKKSPWFMPVGMTSFLFVIAA